MPRLTNRVFDDLAIWMVGFGLVIGLVFPPFCLLLGLPVERVLSIPFCSATVVAGLLVGLVNHSLARLVVGRRFGTLAAGMTAVEGQLAAAVYSQDWSGCDPEACALLVDSDDEAGAAAAAFNRLIRTLAQSHATESAMRGFSAVLSREFELDGLGSAALEGLLRHLRADAGAVLVVRDTGLEPLASHGLRATDDLAASDHVRRALRTNTIERLAVSPGAVVIDSVILGQAPREVLVAPVTFNSVPLGSIVVASTGGFTNDDIALLDQLRADLGLAFNNALAHDRLERLAAVDPLTEAYNRRFGLARLREEFSRAVRAENPLGILMFDLDHFKGVNDTYGHLVGDRVLKAVASSARRVIREGDVLIRYGGEEFLVILPGAGPDDLTHIGERLRRAVAETWTADGDRRVVVTVSLGAAEYGPEIESPEEFVAVADRALYVAKEQGRDRLVVA